MKSLKISLVVFGVTAICAGVFFWILRAKEPETIKAPENQFTRKIEQEISQLKSMPNSKFCKDFFNHIAYHINDFYEQNRFGNNQSENDQWKENLERTLYSEYTDKFIKQTKTVFEGSQWKPDDLKFIQAEKNELKKARLLVEGSPVDQEFTTIQTALDKYDEIVSFISSCEDYTYSKTDLSDRFPIADVQSKITHAASLLDNRLENEFVNNCTRLHDGLREIPQVLFREHVRYLDNKINNWSEKYPNYDSQSDYSSNLYKPLKEEIEALDNGIFNVSNFDDEYSRLLQKWSADNAKAFGHKYQ